MIRVAVDLMGEQKVVLAYVSMRQFWILFPSIAFSFFQLLFMNYPFISGTTEIVFKIILSIFVIGIGACLAFIKFHKYDQYLSTFIINRIIFWKSKKTYTN